MYVAEVFRSMNDYYYFGIVLGSSRIVQFGALPEGYESYEMVYYGWLV